METREATIKYVYIDVVGYSQDRTAEDQTHIINHLNQTVRETLWHFDIVDSPVFGPGSGSIRYLFGIIPIHRRIPQPDLSDIVLIPTGDGMCIAFLDPNVSFDLHIRFALHLLERIAEHNTVFTNKSLQFHIRIGINSNLDNLVTDINGRLNIAGAGITFAQRVMGFADASQILLGQSVYDILSHRDAYKNRFREFKRVTVKHGTEINVFQFIDKNNSVLNSEIPTRFLPAQIPKLTQFAAYYIAFALRNHDLFVRFKDDAGIEYAGAVLLNFLAEDQVEAANATNRTKLFPKAFNAGKTTVEEQLKYYLGLDFSINVELKFAIADAKLGLYSKCFDFELFSASHIFVSQFGKQKLASEYPNVWEEFDLGKK